MAGIFFTPVEQFIDGTGGRIFTRHWEPSGEARANLVICHGVNSHSGQYLGAGQEFASRGYAVTTLDLRGRGRSDGERFYVEHVDDYSSDVAATIELARSHHPDLPVYLLGHSAGGVTSVNYALDHQDQLAGLICESFAFRVHAPNFALKLLEGASHFLPHTHVLRLKMEDFSRIRSGLRNSMPIRSLRMRFSPSRRSPRLRAPANDSSASSTGSSYRC